MKQKRFLLQENELPTQWYNIQADMVNKPMPPIHPATHEPLGWEDLAHIFPAECCKQELDTEHAWIDIPEEVLDKYRYYRSTPLVRAYALEEALGTPAHIYFKNESVNPLGSHKINSALPQAYYAKIEGTLRRQDFRTGSCCLSGENHHAAETLPLADDAHLRRRRDRLALDVNTCW